MCGQSETRPIKLIAAFCAAVVLVGPLAAADPDHPTPIAREHAAATIANAWPAREPLALRPIGVFDSGTGGLAVLEEILKLDAFDNATGRSLPRGDGRADFALERFVFLADQANMPYGNYPACGRTCLLRELVLEDAAFLLGDRFFSAPADSTPSRDKLPAKAVAIACNTATAYALGDVKDFVAEAKLPVPVVGVVDAGAEGALELLGRRGSIGVLATQGTVASGAYPRAIEALARSRALGRPPRVFQQGSLGLAGAIDSAPEMLDSKAVSPRSDYRGPGLNNPRAPIDRRLLPCYDFDFTAGRMLCEGDPRRPTVLQLNSVGNYVAYDVVGLLESVRGADGPPLAVVVLGCTHFPYVAEQIRAQFERLRDYQDAGRFPYRPYLASKIELVDPARLVASNLYRVLAAEGRLARSPQTGPRAWFYMTVPRPDLGNRLDRFGAFTYEYKYGRSAGYIGADVRAVPLDGERLDRATADRLRQRVPAVWQLIQDSTPAERRR